MIESPKNFIEQFQNFIEHIAGVMKTFLTKEVADNYYLGKSEKASSASLADTATKATQDANGNVIPETYATKSELTSGLATKQPVGDYRTKSELDSIYLGINAKAKSAKSADTATTAKSVEWAGVNGIPVLWPKFNYPGIVFVDLARYNQTPWTAPSDGFILQLTADTTANGFSNVYFDGTKIPLPKYWDTACMGWFPVNKGFVLRSNYTGASFVFLPVSMEI